VRSAFLIFGTRVLPGHIHIVRKHLGTVRQLMNDNPALLPVIFEAIHCGDLKATPAATLVQRLKTILCASGLEVLDLYEQNRYGCLVSRASAQRAARRDPIVHFWVESVHVMDEVALTAAGWRFFQRQTAKFHREINGLHRAVKLFKVFNLLGELGVFSAPLDLVRLLAILVQVKDRRLGSGNEPNVAHAQVSARALIAAWAATIPGSDELVRGQVNVLRDWWYEDKPEIASGTKWETLVARATEVALNRKMLNAEEMAHLKWSAPVAAFVTAEALVVTPLVNGAELVDEGSQVNNCLTNTRSYAVRAMQGLSQVFRIQGGQGRATVEMVRANNRGAWMLAQIEGPNAKPVSHPAIGEAVRELELRLNQFNTDGAA
jgi:hypothetical protein